MIRNVRIDDAEQIVNIYNYYIKTSLVTFEEELIDEVEMAKRIKRIAFDEKFPFIVFEENDQILGYAYADTWRTRSAYRYTVESTVYVQKDNYGKSIGSSLYKELMNLLNNGYFTKVVGSITLPNDSSVRLHENMGFVKVAHFNKVGFKLNTWADVGFWELTLVDKN